MRWIDLLWLPPVMMAIALVLGVAGSRSAREAVRSVIHTFVALTLGVLGVGLVLHLVAVFFA